MSEVQWVCVLWSGLGLLILALVLFNIICDNRTKWRKMQDALALFFKTLPGDRHGLAEVGDAIGLAIWEMKDVETEEKCRVFYLSPFVLISDERWECQFSDIFLIEDFDEMDRALDADIFSKEGFENKFEKVDSGEHYLYGASMAWLERVTGLIRVPSEELRTKRLDWALAEIEKIGVEDEQ